MKDYLNRRAATILLLLCGASWLGYFMMGLRFDATPLPTFMQFIDVELLSSRLVESLWYSHAHPPLLNLFAGIGLKLFGEHADRFFDVSFHVFGYLLTLCVFVLTRRLTRSVVAAYVVAGLMVASPAFVLYENWLMYTFPAAMLLAAAAVALLSFLDDGRIGRAVAFFSLLAVLALTRNMFHLLWLVGVAGLLFVACRDRRRTIALAALGPVIVVAGWYGKNLALYGQFAGSSMLGLGLANITTLTVTREELAPLVERGELSPFALISRYEQTDLLFQPQNDQQATGIPVLDTVWKSSGERNFNYRRLIDVNRAYASDAITVARTFPFNYVVGIFFANRLFFSPSDMNEYFPEANLAATAPMRVLFNPLFYGARLKPRYLIQPHFGFDHPPSLEVNTGAGLILAWLIVLPYCYVRARRSFLGSNRERRNTAVLIGFMLVSILYVYGTSTTLELGENYRYKFMIEPIFLVLAAAFAVDAVRAAKAMLAKAMLAKPAPGTS